MQFVSLVSENESSQSAVQELIEQAGKLAAGKIDVIFAFLTAHHRDEAEAIVEKLWLELDPRAIVGCSAAGVIGGDREIEHGPGISLLVGDLPGVRLHPFHISSRDWKVLLHGGSGLAERMGHNDQTRAVVGFGDGFSTPIAQMLSFMNEAMPKSPLVGGMASGSQKPGDNALLKNDQVFSDGMVGLSLSGAVRVQTVVSQGCRPIGRPMVVTKAHSNVVEALGGQPALRAVAEATEALSDGEKHLIRDKGLILGMAISEYKEHMGRGDFLVRHIAGADEASGVINVNDVIRVGQTVQLHVQDAASAREDLEYMLEARRIGEAPAATLLFDCSGRGESLFGEPGHDSALARRAMPGTPIAGFFANGEIGPVGGKNFIHKQSASFAMLRPGD